MFQNKRRENKVNALLDELCLIDVRNTRVSDLSGGQRKRLYRMEMVIDGDLLILDEPTSGLDSKTADTILELLKKYRFSWTCRIMYYPRTIGEISLRTNWYCFVTFFDW